MTPAILMLTKRYYGLECTISVRSDANSLQLTEIQQGMHPDIVFY